MKPKYMSVVKVEYEFLVGCDYPVSESEITEYIKTIDISPDLSLITSENLSMLRATQSEPKITERNYIGWLRLIYK